MARLCGTSGLPCGQSRRPPQSTGRDLLRRNPPAVQDKKSATFLSGLIHRDIHRPQRFACGKGVRIAHRARGFPQLQNGRWFLIAGMPNSRPGARQTPSRPGEPAAPKIPAGYPSPVCSTTGDAIDRIAAAIDQLASDARDAKGEASEAELTGRVAALWQMVSDLDPELARRARRYTGPADGVPSD